MALAPKPIEILAPAGDAQMVRAAVLSGADCVYVGLRGFNARRGAGNFDETELFETVAFCHARNCKVYVALNTLVLSGREKAFAKALYTAQEAGCDAAIVQDLAAVPLAKQIAPNLSLHASTQMSVHSLSGVQKLAELGFSRAILARELREEEIAAIAKHAPIELEVFVHGALCLSVSGQCYFSAFLGGRSGNRGSCAGPCRLPFCGQGSTTVNAHALSLKDLSILRSLPKLSEMGVACAKIEGRLRGPEYCAAVVDAALRAREGKAYDEAFLREVFSRDTFTDGWYGGKSGQDMFGYRSEAAAEQSKKALPKARELYRKERGRVPIDMSLSLQQDGLRLCVSDGIHNVTKQTITPLSLAKEKPDLEKPLKKTGGTPFFANTIQVHNNHSLFAAGSAINALRRDALSELLLLREQVPEKPVGFPKISQQLKTGKVRQIRGLCARFSSVAQLPKEATNYCDALYLPLGEAMQVPKELRSKTHLVLPRFVKQRDETTVRHAVQTAKELGFLPFEVHGLGQWKLCEGAEVIGGFSLNVTNALSAHFLHAQGLRALTASPELSLAQLRDLSLAYENELLVLAYGHLPLMLTRACPFLEKNGCKTCLGGNTLTDRKGTHFYMGCEDGMRSLYNPVPLWMADRLQELSADRALLYFTNETKDEAKTILQAFSKRQSAPFEFTRGLFYRGTEA